jgi:AraC-like DNA-binding protein
MNEFRIISPANEEILLTDELPSNLKKYGLPGGDSLLAAGFFGNMLFHHFKGEGFDIWKSDYLIKTSAEFSGQADREVLELHIPIINDFRSSWEGLENYSLKNMQYEISYTPFVNTKAEFIGGLNYRTFDIHFHKEHLYPYAACCPKLAVFLEKVEKKQPADLLGHGRFLSPDMIRLIHDLQFYTFREELAGSYFKSHVEELLVLMVEQVAEFAEIPGNFVAVHKVEEVKKIIHADFECYHTVEELARMTGTTESNLQMAFKYLYGTTVSKYSRRARLEYGYRLLVETNYPLRVICMMTGYPDPANFSVAFRKQYGFWPGYIQKKVKTKYL